MSDYGESKLHFCKVLNSSQSGWIHAISEKNLLTTETMLEKNAQCRFKNECIKQGSGIKACFDENFTFFVQTGEFKSSTYASKTSMFQ